MGSRAPSNANLYPLYNHTMIKSAQHYYMPNLLYYHAMLYPWLQT